MKDWDTTFIVPLGIGAHLEYWGVPASHIREVDWWDESKVGDLRIVCTPARHASGRLARPRLERTLDSLHRANLVLASIPLVSTSRALSCINALRCQWPSVSARGRP